MNNEKRETILKHYNEPLNYGLIDDENYEKINTSIESCIDNIDIMIKIEHGIIKDIKFEAEACVISKSATSVMIEILLNKTVEEAITICNEYEKMINGENYSEDILETAVIYSDISKQPNRQKCALLPWDGIKKVLIDKQNMI
jgi:SUF system FeS assembly protein, NifU family